MQPVTPSDSAPSRKPRIGVSSCLLGASVRWDGGHKRDRFLTDVLAGFVEWVDVCPEVGIGLGTPRETVHLLGRPEGPRLVGTKTGADHTEAMESFSRAKVDELAALDLAGYVLKSDSPSCGMERVRVYNHKGMAERRGTGAFARVLVERFPLLPIEEEGRLNDDVLRESFLDRVFAYQRFLDFRRGPLTARAIIDFHRVHKYQLMAHSPKHYSELGRLVSLAGTSDRTELVQQYGRLFMHALGEHATRKRHFNVLQHLAGYFKEELDAEGKRELGQAFEDYKNRVVPLVVPIALVRHHVRAFDVAYLKDQTYLAPSPKELTLRNYT
ncbi:MAG: DUF523 and DUF1722 domain-containing protein [Planctomycetes bacterium]|jgi:uncharacterized protein YbgA (DUF1722 family)/uncharacterized protein YbbK (DUF523 family)|nr:DUF523 and DUF1722 domain-containing protein [Planctomycetota bacterium]